MEVWLQAYGGWIIFGGMLLVMMRMHGGDHRGGMMMHGHAEQETTSPEHRQAAQQIIDSTLARLPNDAPSQDAVAARHPTGTR